MKRSRKLKRRNSLFVYVCVTPQEFIASSTILSRYGILCPGVWYALPPSIAESLVAELNLPE